MTKPPPTPAQSLNIFLMKEDIQDIDMAVVDPESLKRKDISGVVGVPAAVWIKRSKSHAPAWARFFRPEIEPTEFGSVTSASAVLGVEVEGRVFALAFGQGRYQVDIDNIEQRFGLKACLNTIDERNVRSIDKRTFDALLTHSRVQTSKAAPIGEFGLDPEQDLLRAATGKPTDQELGEKMSGLDSLTVSVRVTIDTLAKLLPKYLKGSRGTGYRRKYPWVEQIAEVTSESDIRRLDAKLVERVRQDRDPSVWMALPDVVEWSKVDGFRYSRHSSRPLRFDVHLGEWKEDALDGNEPTIETLQRSKVRASDTEGQDAGAWSVYKCLYCEIEEGSATFLLSSGKWYRVKRDLVEQVNDSFRRLARRTTALPSYEHSSEGAYNEAVTKVLPGEYSCHDRRLVRVPTSGGAIEICDLYSTQGELIHVKRYGASSVLSHHFAQAVVSAEALSIDRAAREQFAAQVVAPQSFSPDAFRPSEHPIVLAIVSDQPGELTLPFFSRLNLRHAERRIKGMGYELQLTKVEVAPETRVLKKHLTNSIKR
jgi:uncharacterized protein (TIGR04141 family)